jgi:hypothetical protein
MRMLGLWIAALRALAVGMLSELVAIDNLIRSLPDQLERGLGIGEEIVEIGRRMLEIAERLDQRGYAISELGERLDARAVQLLELGQSMHDVGIRIDATGTQIVDRAGHVIATAGELITILPTVERALDLASPLEGAIDRFGRIVDRFPGATTRRQPRPPAGAPLDDRAPLDSTAPPLSE